MKKNILYFKIKYLYIGYWLIYLRNKLFFTPPDTSNIFFILGSGRNGSTLLSTMLNGSANVFIPPEEYFLPYGLLKWTVLPLKREKKIYSILRDVFFLKKTSNWELKRKSVDVTDYIESEQPVNFTSLYTYLISSYAEQRGKPNVILGDKTPLNTLFTKYLILYFPKSKFIFLLRDGRDVIHSYQKLDNHPAQDPKYAAWLWNNSIKEYHRLVKSGKKVLLVKYKDLVSSPESTMKKICRFLNINYSNDMLNFQNEAQNMGVDDKSYHKNLYKPLTNSTIGSYKNNMDKETYNIIFPLIKDNLKKFNYIKE